MRTIKDILAIDPNARFSCDSVEFGAFADDEILEQISSPTWKEDLINKAKELIGDSDKSWRVGKVGTN